MNPVKPLIVLGTGGALATGAYLTKGYGLPDSKEKPKSISQVLASNKYVPLDTSKVDGGDAVLAKYQAANPSGAKDVSQLQEECKVLTSKEFNDADYKKARRGCVEAQSVTQD